MSYILLRAGQPPFVLPAAHAAAYFDRSTRIRALHKGPATSLFRAPLLRRRLAALVRRQADPRYLRG